MRVIPYWGGLGVVLGVGVGFGWGRAGLGEAASLPSICHCLLVYAG